MTRSAEVRTYLVREGDCLASIAFRFGVAPSEIWDHPDNAELRQRRADSAIMQPGDRLVVPEPAARPSFAVSPGGSHTFRARVPRHQTKLRLLHGSEPRRNKRCTVLVDGHTHALTTNGDGELVIPLRPTSRVARVTVHDQVGDVPFDDTFEVFLGGLDPLESISGVQARLKNLGYWPGPVDGDHGPRTRRALADFQRARGLEVTGEADEATRSGLRDAHGG